MRRLLALPLAFVALTAFTASAKVETESLDDGARYKVTFKHSPVIAAKTVHVAGSFNNWDPKKTPMKDVGAGVYSTTLELKKGRYSYKFVLNGDVWQHDGDNSKSEPDGKSGLNSVLELGSGEPSAPGKEGDGKVDAGELLHDPASIVDCCAVDGGRRLGLRMQTLASDAQEVRVDATPRPDAAHDKIDADGTVPLRKICAVNGHDVWEARLYFAKGTTNVRYQFLVKDGETVVGLGKKGASSKAKGKEAGRWDVSMAHASRFETPEWTRDAVFYQVFVDRFQNGDKANDPKKPRRPEGKAWGIDDGYLEEWGVEPAHFNFFGGDLKGVEQKLDYIKSLGVNALYLNPVFTANSNHKYDCADFESIDPAFGTQKDYEQLVAACESRGMRVILDAVFNHTGDGHYMFQDCVKNGPRSKWWKWYFFEADKVTTTPKPNYKCWWGFGTLPQLNTKNPEVVSHLLHVGEKWLKAGSAGWRLDVPNEVEAVNPDFWPEFRRRVKKAKPDAYIVGEIWTDAREYLKGDRFDAVMNYPFRSAALEFLAKGDVDAKKFDELLAQQRATYPEPVLRVQFNLLGSHDTERVLHVAKESPQRVRLCQTFQFAYLGPPVVYYGDEVGVSGGKDPECRRCMPWDEAKQDQETRAHVERLGKARAKEAALRRGTVRTIHAEGKVFAFVREAEAGEAGRTVLCVLNAGDSAATVELPVSGSKARDLLVDGRMLEAAEGKLRVEVGALSGSLFSIE
ncbi:MAG: alpha amylase N-terminal ig-like domain-containing protein [Planctomycetota bacterium]